jgi:hypothetical protein
MDTIRPIPLPKILAWLRAHKQTQADLAHAIGREPSLVSRVLRGKVKSEPVWAQIHAYKANPTGYRRPTIRSVRMLKTLRHAQRLLERARRNGEVE